MLDRVRRIVCADPAGELDVWCLRCSEAELDRVQTGLLDEAERERAHRLHGADDRRRFLTAHVLLRELLARHLRVPPAELLFRRDPCPACGGPHGRPSLIEPAAAPQFSLSYSADLILVAIAPRPVGVDVESFPRVSDADAVAGLLHPLERAQVSAAAEAERAAVFTRLWARKEAYLKGVGTGIARGLDRYVADDEDSANADWTVIDLPLAAGYAGAAAISTQSRARVC